jgi:hypothetical protein
MESQTANQLSIHYNDETYHAAICQRCGTKIYPAEQLDAHMDRHQLKDLYLEDELKRLRTLWANHPEDITGRFAPLRRQLFCTNPQRPLRFPGKRR